MLYTGFPRFLKVLEFQTYGFKAWKVLENKHRSLKVLELNFVYGAISKIVHMRCQRQKEMALMIEGGDQGRAETFGGAGAQSIKGAHGTRLLIGLFFADMCIEMDASVLIQQQMP